MRNFHLIIVRAANQILNRVERLLRRDRFLSRPQTINLEVSSLCDTTCQLCPVGNGLAKTVRDDKERFMSLENFRRLIDQCQYHLRTIHFGMWGEPILNPDLAAMVAYAHEKSMRTVLFTNGIGFRTRQPELAQALFDVGLTEMVISLHGMSQKSFATYQPGKRVDDRLMVIERVAAMLTPKRRRKTIRISFAISSANEHELERFHQWCEQVGIQPDAYPAAVNIRQWRDTATREQMLSKWKPTSAKPSGLYGYYDAVLKGKAWEGDPVRRDCFHLSQNLNILVNGDLVSCCSAFPSQGQTFRSEGHVIGNINDQTVLEVWNGWFYRKGRRISLRCADRDPNEDCSDHHCAHCIEYIS